MKQKKRLPFFVFVITYIALIPIILYLARDTDDQDEFPFSAVLSNRAMNGLKLEPEKVRAEVQILGQKYLKYKKNSAALEEDSETLEECELSSKKLDNPFCHLILGLSQKNRSIASIFRTKKREAVKKIQIALKAKNIASLSQFPDSDLSYAFRGKSALQQINLVTLKALSMKTCPSSALLFSMGMRLEEEFPNLETRDRVKSLYQRAFECGDDVAAMQAGYRLSLLKIWDNSCEGVEEVLSKVQDNPSASDYQLRSGYWRFHCADVLGNSALKKNMLDWLNEAYPLSLHVILARKRSNVSQPPIRMGFDPMIRYRTKDQESLNSVVRSVEWLIEQDELGAAVELLLRSTPETANTDISFRLYWAILLHRSGHIPKAFQVMVQLLKERPDYLCSSTLELLYPVQLMEIIRDIDAPIDPFLVIAQIRQESAFKEDARSPAGAMGLMQLLLPTARGFEKKVSRTQLYDPKVNIRLGIKYMKRLLGRYDGSAELALAAYNAGPTRVQSWLKRYPVSNRLLFLDLIPVRETRDYVAAIARSYHWYHFLNQDQNFKDIGPLIHDFDIFSEI